MSNNYMDNSPTHRKIKNFKHDQLRELLVQCKPKQIDLFNRMYGSVDTIDEDKIDWAIRQCELTIIKNKNGV